MKSPTIRQMLGGGNFTNAEADANATQQFQILQNLGATMCRINLYPGVYRQVRDWNKPNVAVLDDVMKLAHRHNVTPMLLFEYYSEYHKDDGLGDYQQWRNLAYQFANRYKPNGEWGRKNNIKDFGIRVYSAFNEPEMGEFRAGGKLGVAPYLQALRGLGDGVHAAGRSLIAQPGGFMAANAWNDWTLRGLGTALAPLYNDRVLDAIDLHTYYDIEYAPMEKGFGDSAQSNFDDVKRACGIRRDVFFASTEFNYKKRKVTEEEAARGFFTGIWDNLGIVGNSGANGKALFAFPWNIFNETAKDEEYGLSLKFQPHAPTTRGQVLRTLLEVAGDARFTSYNPRKTGTYTLSSDDGTRTVWVWQNRNGWTTTPGTNHTIANIPKNAREIEVHGWNGLRRRVPTGNSATTLRIGELEREETHLFVARTA